MITLEYFKNKLEGKISFDTEIRNETTIVDLGLDSLDFIELLYSIEQDYGIEIKFKNINPNSSIGEFLQFINSDDAH